MKNFFVVEEQIKYEDCMVCEDYNIENVRVGFHPDNINS